MIFNDFEPPPRGKQSNLKTYTVSDMQTQVDIGGKRMIRQDWPESPPNFQAAAGKSCKELSEQRNWSPSMPRGPRTGYAWGKLQDADPSVQRAFRGAAGADPPSLQPPVKRLVFDHKEACNRNFHCGLHQQDKDPGGQYDFRISGVGRKARSVPKRRSQVKEIIRGEQAKPAFSGDEEAFHASAGIGSLKMTDPRQKSPNGCSKASHSGTWL